MGSGASTEEYSEAQVLKMKDELKRKNNEISVLQQKVRNLTSNLLHEREKKERKNLTEITSSEIQSTGSKMKLNWHHTYRSLRIIWLVKELEALDVKVEKDFELLPPITRGKSTGGRAHEILLVKSISEESSIESTRVDTNLNKTMSEKTIQQQSSSNASHNETRNSVSGFNSNSIANLSRMSSRDGTTISKLSRKSSTVTVDQAVNPHGTTLSLVGPHFSSMFESGAICMYMAEKYGQLVPAIKYRSRYYEFIIYATSTLDPLLDMCYENTDEVRTQELNSDMKTKFKECMEYLEGRLEGKHNKKGDKNFLCGQKLTVADCIVGCDLYYMEMMLKEPTVFKAYPNLQRYFEGITSLKTFKSAIDVMDDGRIDA